MINQIKESVKRDSTQSLYVLAMVFSCIEIFLTTIESIIEFNKSQSTQADIDDKAYACSGCFLLTALGIVTSFLIFFYLPDDLAVTLKEENQRKSILRDLKHMHSEIKTWETSLDNSYYKQHKL